MYYLLSLKGVFIEIPLPFLQKGNLNPSVTLYQNLAVCYFFCQLVTLHRLYIRTVSSYLARPVVFLLKWWKLVYLSFGQSNMHRALNFCPDQTSKLEIECTKAIFTTIYTYTLGPCIY